MSLGLYACFRTRREPQHQQHDRRWKDGRTGLSLQQQPQQQQHIYNARKASIRAIERCTVGTKLHKDRCLDNTGFDLFIWLQLCFSDLAATMAHAEAGVLSAVLRSYFYVGIWMVSFHISDVSIRHLVVGGTDAPPTISAHEPPSWLALCSSIPSPSSSQINGESVLSL